MDINKPKVTPKVPGIRGQIETQNRGQRSAKSTKDYQRISMTKME